MSPAATTIALLCVATVAIRAAGPVLLGGRELPATLKLIVALLAPALLAALVVVETVGAESGSGLAVDERIAGVAAAGAILTVRRNLLLPAVLCAAAVTALLRAL